ncbi:MAG: hypothetical protein R3F43_03140 [bacterium]
MSTPNDWSAETRRTLRFWGVAEALHGGLLAAAVLGFVPWKTVWINLALVAYAGLHVVAGAGLLLRRRWGWRLGIVAGLLGLVLMVVVTSGLVASWAYLHAIYGDFGLGASVGALIFASLALQVLGLVPGLLLRALLREAVRGDLGGGRGVIRAALGLLVLPVVVGFMVHCLAAMPTLEPVSPEGRSQAIAHLRAALRGEARPATPALVGVPVGAAPVWVTLYRGASRRPGCRGRGPTWPRPSPTRPMRWRPTRRTTAAGSPMAA